MRTQSVVVGTDGTDSARAAVDWAAREARRRHLSLRIVCAYDWDRYGSGYDAGSEFADIPRKLAEAVMAASVRQAGEAAPDIEIEADARVGPAGAVLLEVAEAEDLMVVGGRGRGGFAGLLLGSVSRRVALRASCPVVVVRRRDEATAGPVVVGVGESPVAEHALEAAFGAAADRGCGLLAVRSYLPPIPHLLPDVLPAKVDPSAQEAVEGVRLEEQLAPWRAKHPDVPVGITLTGGSTVAALVAASRSAQLVVLGNTGRGVVAGTLIGSATLQLLRQAHCPVYVAR